MIGVNILQNPKEFQQAFDAGHDIAVHTYTHPYMTTLSNLDVVAQVNICAFFLYRLFLLAKNCSDSLAGQCNSSTIPQEGVSQGTGGLLMATLI